MKPFDRLLETFETAAREFDASAPIQFLASEAFRPRHYAALLREIYFYTRENPQLQASMTLAFRGTQRQAVKRVMGHALAEVGHDQLALEDLARLGVDVDGIPDEEPLATTIPLTAYPLYLFHHARPVGYLGQIFFLEFLPTRSGPGYVRRLLDLGVPESALSFVAEHAEVDVQHNRLMERHAADLLGDPADLEAACSAIRVCAHNYAALLQGAFDNAERFTAVDARCERKELADAS